ncbi:hypothetical protein KQ306_00110 [Synechococcus sp. CS-1324]|uniref:hypothetical protein n=1 Tax=Synechococcus sp. CS-1324 TaxID=2847980 RepID=UPI000DB2BAE2|nr:hypothetical protein [Synechococcus sp. CS-1324]MCT0229269.1 hypothetical protein [Synechococcus sp. CS-1324]PZV06274.1 MAG: hypothetical protein DCF23_00330 [Cyanobium sp.]
MLLCLAVLLIGGWSLRPPNSPPAEALSPSPPSGALQEVAPPLPVQQLQGRLAKLQPQLRILSPEDDALLPSGPWELQLSLDDWPLVGGGGSLGIGPHLVVQLDDQPPRRIVEPQGDGSGPVSLQVPMEPLSPGSHRLTVYAARPWGEAVKSRGGFRQIRLHRVAANPLQLPPPGSAQLISAIPVDWPMAEPVPIDWLLLDAPLQHLRGDDRQWLLRVTVNGDSFLTDQQATLWLKGLRPGANALQLELLDGLGEPLNPPFNSLVREVTLAAGGNRWQQGKLTDQELDQRLGRTPAPALEPTAMLATSNLNDADQMAAEQEGDAAEPTEPEESQAEADQLVPDPEPTPSSAPSSVQDDEPEPLAASSPHD